MNLLQQQLEFQAIKDTIAKYCAFSLGRKRIEDLTATFGSKQIERELRKSKDALDLVIQHGSLPFFGIRDIHEALEIALKDGICIPSDLLDIAAHAQGCAHLQSFVKNTEMPLEYLSEYVDSLAYSLPLSQNIEQCISDNGEVRDNASPLLRQLKREQRDCESELSSAAQKFVRDHSDQLMDSITTTRNGRIVVLVKINEKNKVKGIIHGESASGQTAYIEPEILMQLNNKLQSLSNQIEEEILRILFELSQEVKVFAPQYEANLETLAILDSLNAKALWAKEHNAIIPEINDRKEISLKNARHPLIDSKKVVGNSYYLKPPKSVLLITGPNTGGKTVSLKIIGLFTYMAFCGMAVCADEANIPIVDAIYLDMGDDQSIVQSLSTFSSHLLRLAEICKNASSNALVLLDELGSGTDPREGESLAIGVLDYLREIGSLTIVTTHYGGLKTYGKIHEDVLLASVEFDVKEMKPTYRYLEGYTGQSNALEIALRYGVLPEVIDRAREHFMQTRTSEEEILEELEKDRFLIDQMKQEVLLAKETLFKEQEAFVQTQKNFETQKGNYLQEAKSEAEAYLNKVQEEAEGILKEIKRVERSGKLHEAIQLEKQLAELQEAEQEVIDTNYVAKIGDIVRVQGTVQQGEVVTINRDNAELIMNGLRMRVPLHKLTFVKEKEKGKQEKSSYKVDRPNSIPLEVNLIGMRVEEALIVLDKYLDDCLLANYGSARIVHGHGTGALRTAVHERLKKTPSVEGYQLAPQQEGGSGATIVRFAKKS